MHKTIEAIIDTDGTVRLLEPVEPGKPRRALLTILDESEEQDVNETALLSEKALSDWGTEEEDKTWSHLQPER